MFKTLFSTLLLTLVWVLNNIAYAEPPTLKNMLSAEEQLELDKTTSTETLLIDEYDRGSPRASMEGFLMAANQADYERASHYLDLRNLPAKLKDVAPEELVRQLKIVLDRMLWVDLHALSNSNLGLSADGLPSYRDSVGKIPVGDRMVHVYLQRVPRKDGERIWKISNATIAQVPAMYQQHGDGPLGEYLSLYLPDIEVLGLESWQFVMMILLFLGAYIFLWPIFWLLIRFGQRRDPESDALPRFISGPLRLLTIVLVVRSQFELLRPSLEARAVAEGQTLFIIAIAWVIVAGLELTRKRLHQKLISREREQGALLLRPLFNVLKILVMLIALLIWLENLGFKASTMLAGLGIGGLAIALAAQKSVENLIGAITLYVSTPVKAGDFCKFGSQTGVVEEIGLRFTRVRTIDRTVINIPNATFVDLHLENYSEREKIRYSPAIKLRLDSRSDQVQTVLSQIKSALISHPLVDEAPLRVRLKDFGTHALEVNVLCYLNTIVFDEYLEAAEELNLQILKILEENQVAPADLTQYRVVNAPL
ncbi:mechanosensitive ion channel family protein [Echinimonas agarilytica]|uniref:Mechanosensitive ion channel family protein n=1 Tax=Echinimonas agarilytica TaxID=1215918 RepID=A0AA42B8A1_9GAMM|nr:mechanosensitive ion channel family protein [Echinimonas agarilytica]MCM2680950.1 mechanosensitive ion channel family protein [Echinimonas agarilytica]